jgi:hypothetical protein
MSLAAIMLEQLAVARPIVEAVFAKASLGNIAASCGATSAAASSRKVMGLIDPVEG